MSEIIQHRIEPIIKEIIKLEREVFSVMETKCILENQTKFEYKINGPAKSLEDYKDYIQHEKLLLKNIQLRKNKFRIPAEKRNLELKMITRIKQLYELALSIWGNDFHFILSYFEFCKESHFHQAASHAVHVVTTKFTQYPETWQVAADWYMTQDIRLSLKMIHKGLIIHPQCENLYYKGIQMEFMAKKIYERSENVQTQYKDDIFFERIDSYIDTIIKKIDNYEYQLKILKLLEEHNCVEHIQHKIIEQLMVKYCNEVVIWQALAVREKNGHHYPIPEDLRVSTRFRLTRCLEKFEMGLLKICPEKKTTLWLIYLDFLIKLYKQKGVANHMIKTTLIKKLEEASVLSIPTERHYLIWSKILKNDKNVLKVIEVGLKVFPKSVELWKQKLKCIIIIKNNPRDFNIEFKKGYLELKEESGPLWTLLINYHLVTSSDTVIESIYRDACRQNEPIGNQHKPEFVEWVAFAKDIKDARRVYQELAAMRPFCMELHKKMGVLELQETNIDVKELERPLKLACEQFGSEDVDVWIDLRNCYLEFQELFENIDPNFNVTSKILQIRNEALQAIKDNAILLVFFRHIYDFYPTTRVYEM